MFNQTTNPFAPQVTVKTTVQPVQPNIVPVVYGQPSSQQPHIQQTYVQTTGNENRAPFTNPPPYQPYPPVILQPSPYQQQQIPIQYQAPQQQYTVAQLSNTLQQTSISKTCFKCQGKGGYGTFGPAPPTDFHFKGHCVVCNGQGKFDEPACPKCNGKGGYGTFGPCEITPKDTHFKGLCPTCDGKCWISSSFTATKCHSCEGKGGMGTFGACEPHDIHFKGHCSQCKGKCFIFQYPFVQPQVVIQQQPMYQPQITPQPQVQIVTSQPQIVPQPDYIDRHHPHQHTQQIQPQPSTPSPALPIPLIRYKNHNDNLNAFFLTSNPSEIGISSKGQFSKGYTCLGALGGIFPTPGPGLVPLLRYYSGREHFYTTNEKELGNGVQGWKYEGIACYVYKNPMTGTIGLQRFYHSGLNLHVYTVDSGEVNLNEGWKSEGIEGYLAIL